jgi:hypothetical protein
MRSDCLFITLIDTVRAKRGEVVEKGSTGLTVDVGCKM